MSDPVAVYGKFNLSLAGGLVNWLTDTIKIMLCDSGYTPDQDTHQFKSSVTNEIKTTATTLSSSAAAAATTVSVAASIPVGNYVQVGTSDNVRQVTAVSGSGPYTLTLSTGLTSSAASGATVQTNPGYTAGGITLANKTATYDGSTNTTVLDADDVTWSAAYIPPAHTAVVYKSTGTDSTSPLVCVGTFSTDKTASNGSLVVQFDATGIVRLSAV